jgi:hypothetical protein
MKITKSQLKQIVKEETQRLFESRDWDLEDNVSYFITVGPAKKAIKYLGELIAHAEAGGEVDWKMAMNSHEEEHTSLEYAKERLEMLNKGTGIGRTRQSAAAATARSPENISERLGIRGPEAVAAKILDPAPRRLGEIAAAAGMRSGSAHPHSRAISQQIAKYIKTVCAPAIVKIVEDAQGGSTQ